MSGYLAYKLTGQTSKNKHRNKMLKIEIINNYSGVT